MKVLSIQTGQPKTVSVNGREVVTSIFKSPIEGPVQVKSMGIESDSQSDLTVHGGQYKAVYAYPSEHLPFWKAQVPQHEFGFGAFGENLDTTGLLETSVSIGDTMKIGSVVLRVSQPRFPCFKLGIKFDDKEMIKRFHDNKKSGFYFEVLEEGIFQKGDSIEIVNKSGGVSIYDFVTAYVEKKPDKNLLKSLLDDPHLIEDWRPYFTNKL